MKEREGTEKGEGDDGRGEDVRGQRRRERGGGGDKACEEGERKGERSEKYSLSSVYLTHVLPVPGGWSSTAGPGPP